jgi:hypothetical protein
MVTPPLIRFRPPLLRFTIATSRVPQPGAVSKLNNVG